MPTLYDILVLDEHLAYDFRCFDILEAHDA